MREERFRIQCPKHFLVGDSGRFEKSPQGKDSDFCSRLCSTGNV